MVARLIPGPCLRASVSSTSTNSGWSAGTQAGDRGNRHGAGGGEPPGRRWKDAPKAGGGGGPRGAGGRGGGGGGAPPGEGQPPRHEPQEGAVRRRGEAGLEGGAQADEGVR